ncbi:Rho guanine nucleotide exchange factor 17 [Pseudolycoriella hygida]|uniref:Rho guanine nucleotide exchange factor 17 n=1 Tax=Pseudolycoriella hygida TaxID=35572 RepID=A0A9Q0RWI4_9DIPT|nr:Rho guanine nucleotide exchange factor 17 [Pseudolycoriella hygida]
MSDLVALIALDEQNMPLSDAGSDSEEETIKESKVFNWISDFEDDTRTHVVIELFNTEKSYVDSLETVVLKYLKPLKSPENAGIVDIQTVEEIFLMVPTILNVHKHFLDELKRRLDSWEPSQMVGDAFIDTFSKSTVLDAYAAFVNNWNRAKDAIRSTSATRPAFSRFLEAMAREHKGKLSLDNLLIKPVQKFPNYELLFLRLVKHTNIDHPDQKPLQNALQLVHSILLHLNCKEREALENNQRETLLRDIEGIIEGVSELVMTERQFLSFDLVSIPSGQAGRKERGFFLFSDLLVITSIKRRTGTMRKPNSCPVTLASTLDTNKYKFLTKIPIDDLEVVKAKDENVEKVRKEIDNLSKDLTKLGQIMDIASSLRIPNHQLEEIVRDLQKEVQRQLSDRQSNDTQLNILELALKTANGVQISSMEKYPVPEFISCIPIRKTRAGLQFTCAAPTLGTQKDVWVCNSDGYVGQVCVLSLFPEPTVVSCNGVCNARILCVTSIPANVEASSSTSSFVSISIEDTTRHLSACSNTNSKKSDKCSESILDSSSSSDSETDLQEKRIPTTSNRSDQTQSDEQQSTMWLGTEDGCIHVYLDNRVFVSLANGDIVVYNREGTGWNTASPNTVTVGTVSHPATKLINVHGKLWCSVQGNIKILNTSTLQVENNIKISTDGKPITNMVSSTNHVWVSVLNSANIKCFHSNSYELLQEVNLAPQVNKMLSNCDDIIRQHKAACLRVTSLLACKDMIWVGTSAGVLLTISAIPTSIGIESPIVTGIPYGHTGHVRFLTCVEYDKMDGDTKANTNRQSLPIKAKSDSTNLLIISGGDGYEDFRNSGAHPSNEVSGREDSTNHLLLWNV